MRFSTMCTEPKSSVAVWRRSHFHGPQSAAPQLVRAGWRVSLVDDFDRLLKCESSGSVERCDLIVLEADGEAGEELTAILNTLRRAEHAAPRLVVLHTPNVPLAVAAMKAGATDVVEGGESMLPLAEVAQRMVIEAGHGREEHLRRCELRRRVRELSPRDRLLLHRLVAGSRASDVAEEFHVSVRTAEALRSKLEKKLACANLALMVAAVTLYAQDLLETEAISPVQRWMQPEGPVEVEAEMQQWMLQTHVAALQRSGAGRGRRRTAIVTG